MRPLVTVFIPTYNSEKYIKESLDSIISQTYNNLEILIIDNCSTDNTINIINSYNDSRIRLLINESNRGLVYSRNKGLKNARGKYIALQDSDDISFNNRINTQLEFLERNENIDIVYSEYISFPRKAFLNFDFINKRHLKAITSNEIKFALLFHNIICNPSVMMRLETIRNTDVLYNSRFESVEDYHLWSILVKNANFHFIQEPLLFYRTGHQSVSSISHEEQNLTRKKLIKEIKINIINNFNISFEENEMDIFLEFFSEGKNYSFDLLENEDSIKLLYLKIVRNDFENFPITKKHKIFLLNKLYINKIFTNINLKFLQKIQMYHHVVNNKKFIDYIYIAKYIFNCRRL